eukprot:6649797-Pyramimonas_sp.AAC.1
MSSSAMTPRSTSSTRIRRHAAGGNTGPHGAHCSHSGKNARSVEGTGRAGVCQNSIRANPTCKFQSLSVVT